MKDKTFFKTPLYFLFILISGLAFNLTPANAQKAKTKTLTVGVAGHAPFITSDSSLKTGIAMGIWQSIAEAQGLQYDTVRFENVPEALAALQRGKLDLVIGPISITSDRLKRMNFSQPYFYSGMSILSRSNAPTIWGRIKPFFSKKLLLAVIAFLGILAIVGTLIWLTEREKSPDQFPKDFSHGIANGMWLAIVTMSTTGYGDRAPITFWGRVIAGTWMVVSIIFGASMVAGIASTLTLNGLGSDTITEASQLKGKKVATPSENVAKDFIYEFHAKPVQTESLDQAVKLLENNKVDAVVFDRPQLLYYRNTHPLLELYVTRSEYDPNGYGFAFPLNSSYTLIKEVNVEMKKLNEVGRVKQIVKDWLGNEDD